MNKKQIKKWFADFDKAHKKTEEEKKRHEMAFDGNCAAFRVDKRITKK